MLTYHKPILKEKVLYYLNVGENAVIVDGTLGDGGHSEWILQNSSPKCRLIGIDQDPEALNRARQRLQSYKRRISFVHGNFSELKQILEKKNVPKIDGLLLDLGVSSNQLDSPSRGFSFRADGPLDMRMNTEADHTAKTLLETLSDTELQNIIKNYGEERFHKRIVKAIRKAQLEGPITTTLHLSKILTRVIPQRSSQNTHSSTRTFQALRIAVNNELENLQKALDDSVDCLNASGRMVVISFHSIEDGIVKRFFQREEKGCQCPPKIPVCICGRKPKLKILTRKPIRSEPEEQKENPRSTSSRLRAAERIYV